DDVEGERGGNHPVVIEGIELRGQLHPSESGRQPDDRHCRVEVDAGREGKAHGPAKRFEIRHSHPLAIGPAASSAATRARTCWATASRLSTVAPAVSTGSPKRMDTITGKIHGLPFRMASRAPMIATGTMGACAR